MSNKKFFYASLIDAVHKIDRDDEGVLLYYHGPFNRKVISQISQDLRQQLAHPPKLGWKVFYVFVELIQNIYFYASEYNTNPSSSDPVGMVFVEEKADAYEITTGNLATLESFEAVQSKCQYINQLSHEDLREYKYALLKKAATQEHHGGSVGLVQIALLSHEQIAIELKAEQEGIAFFSVTTTIKK